MVRENLELLLVAIRRNPAWPCSDLICTGDSDCCSARRAQREAGRLRGNDREAVVRQAVT
jgi:hypothetical protein